MIFNGTLYSVLGSCTYIHLNLPYIDLHSTKINQIYRVASRSKCYFTKTKMEKKTSQFVNCTIEMVEPVYFHFSVVSSDFTLTKYKSLARSRKNCILLRIPWAFLFSQRFTISKASLNPEFQKKELRLSKWTTHDDMSMLDDSSVCLQTQNKNSSEN